MATGIEGVCYHSLVYKADQWTVLVPNLQAVFIPLQLLISLTILAMFLGLE